MEAVSLRISDVTLRGYLFTAPSGEVSVQIPIREVTSNGGILVCSGEHPVPKAPPPTLSSARGSEEPNFNADQSHSDSEFSVVGELPPQYRMPTELVGSVTKDEQTRILAATTAQTLHNLCPIFIAIHETKIDSVGDWTPRARLARAFRAGLSVRWQRRDQRCPLVESAIIETRRSPVCYVILKCSRYPGPVWAHSLKKYREVLQQPDRTLEPNSYSHSFLSTLEGQVYLEAAGYSWKDAEQVP